MISNYFFIALLFSGFLYAAEPAEKSVQAQIINEVVVAAQKSISSARQERLLTPEALNKLLNAQLPPFHVYETEMNGVNGLWYKVYLPYSSAYKIGTEAEVFIPGAKREKKSEDEKTEKQQNFKKMMIKVNAHNHNGKTVEYEFCATQGEKGIVWPWVNKYVVLHSVLKS
ncbi:MAG TPA: hypothetical protein VFF04_03275 [Candidatus Babeliales bacterium]|nr:hypothetical protein [Candidatus Babeliales bacterium]